MCARVRCYAGSQLGEVAFPAPKRIDRVLLGDVDQEVHHERDDRKD
jgi:hypothetical protein